MQYYIPSGKYSPNAPVIFCVIVFISSAVTGIIYAWAISEFGVFKYTDLFFLPLCLFFAICINYSVITRLIIRLKVRSPVYFRRLAIMFTLAGWSLSFIALYLIAHYVHKVAGDVFDFFYYRLSNGIVVGASALPSDFIQISKLFLFSSWVFEISFISLLMGNVAKCQAELPFSESSKKWHRGLHLWPSIVKPDKKDVYNNLRDYDITSLLSSWPDKYLILMHKPQKVPRRTLVGWGRLSILIPEQEGDFYVSLSGQTCSRVANTNLLSGKKQPEYIHHFWIVSSEKSDELIQRWEYPRPAEAKI